MKKMIILVFVLMFLMLLLNIDKYTGKTIPRWLLEDAEADWERYYLDEEANKDKLYCRTTEDEHRNVIETRWYNSFINPNEVVRVDKGDTTTPNCEWPMHTPLYAKGSNKGKNYSRIVMDFEGNILQTTWYDACTDEIIQVDEGDTTFKGSNNFVGKCYHPNYIINDMEEVTGMVEEEKKETIVESYIGMGEKVVNWFKGLFDM